MYKAQHIVVVSEDAMVYDDLEELQYMPCFGRILPQAAIVESVRSVYPTLTYPNHTSMRTGAYCYKHGIINNEKTILGEVKSKWELFNDAVKIPDIFDAAKAAGLTTGSDFWPVTGNHKSIDYLVNEYWPQYPGQTTEECYAESGSSPETIEKVVHPSACWINNFHRKHPYTDFFKHACAAAMIREFKPNLMFLHSTNLDSYRHETGVFSRKVTHGLHEADSFLATVLKACDEVGITDKTDFFVVSDHGQVNIRRVIALNALLADKGLLTIGEDGQIADYTAIAKSMGMSAQIYLKNPADTERVYAILQEMCDDGLYGFTRVYTAEEIMREEGLAGKFSFVIESDGYTSFSNDWQRPWVRCADNSDYKFGHGTHGHNPDVGPQPPLIAWGPDIRPGVRIKRKPIVDEAPTYAKILGLSLPDADGKPIDEILW